MLLHGILPDPLVGRVVAAEELLLGDLGDLVGVLRTVFFPIPDLELLALVGDLDDVGPREGEEFRLLLEDGDAVVAVADQHRVVLLVLRVM